MAAKKILNTSAPKNDKIVTQPVQTAPVSKTVTTPEVKTVSNPTPSVKTVAETRPYSTPNYSQQTTRSKVNSKPSTTTTTPTVNTTTTSTVNNLPATAPAPTLSNLVNTAAVTPTVTEPVAVEPTVSGLDQIMQNAQQGQYVPISFNNGLFNANATPAERTNSLLDTLSALPGIIREGISNYNNTGIYYPGYDRSDPRYAPTENIIDEETLAEALMTPNRPESGLDFIKSYLSGNGQAARNTNTASAYDALSNALSSAARDALVYSDRPNANPNAPYMEVPNVGGLAYDSLVNPTTVIASTPTTRQATNLTNALENAAYDALVANGVDTTPSRGGLYQQLVDPANYNYDPAADLAAMTAASEGSYDERGKGGDTNVSVNTSSGSGRSGGTGGRLGGGNGLSGLSGLGNLDISSLYDLLNQRLAEYDSNYGNLMNSLYDLYNNNANSLSDYYQQALNALGLNFNDTQSNLADQLSNSQEALEAQRRRQLQEAYISRMMNEKNLADTLSAYGLSGGATESVLTNLRNNYNNTRNSVEENIQTSLRDLLQTYMNNLSTARQRYNENVLNTENSRVSAMNTLLSNLATQQANAMNNRTAARAGAYDDLFDTLANLYAKGYQLS